jgi:hypothetical protein
MPYQIRLHDHSQTLDETADAENFLDHITFQLAVDSWRLSDLDPFGTTTFNRIQASRVLEEIQSLRPHAQTISQKALLARLEEMLERCRDSENLLITFHGG